MNGPQPRVTYDQCSDALYLSFVAIAPGGVAKTREVSAGVFLDFDAEGRLLGMEVLEASKLLAAEATRTAD